MITVTQITCFKFGTIIFAQNILLKIVKSNYTSVFYCVWLYAVSLCPPQIFANLVILYISTSFSILNIFILGCFTHKIDVLGVLQAEFPMQASWAGKLTR
jgi:hypothetical protein